MLRSFSSSPVRRAAAALVSVSMIAALGTAPASAQDDSPPTDSPEPTFEAANVEATDAPMADRDADKVLDGVEKELAEAATDETVEVIVQVDDPSVIAQAERIIDGPVESFDVVDGFAAELTPDEAAEIAALPGVEQVEADEVLHALNGDAGSSIGATAARTAEGVTGNKDGSEGTYSAGDVVIAVIDTGIDNRHLDLDGGKVIAWQDFVNFQTTPYDDHGHGTHVAGSAAGEGQVNASNRGVAPGAALIGVKVLNSGGTGSSSTVIQGVQWAVDNKATYGIDIINLSLGGSGCSDGTDAISQAVNAAVAQGIVVVTAAGNAGPARCTIGSPAAAANVITIGAVANLSGNGGFTATNYSSRGPTADNRNKPDAVAPGSNIASTQAGTTTGYALSNGSSMAAGIASGAVALMLDANPAQSPAQIKSALVNTAQDWGRANDFETFASFGPDTQFGAGVIDVTAAVRSVKGSSPATSLATHARLEGVVAAGETISVPIEISSTNAGLGASLLHTDVTSAQSSSIDLDLYLRRGSSVVASALSTQRAESLGHLPSSTGTHQLDIKSVAGNGEFVLDVSGPIALPVPPGPPTLTGASQSGASATISWSAPAGGGPVAYYSVISDQAGLHRSVAADARSTTVAGLGGGATYNFKVIAHNLAGTASSDGTVITTPTPPPPPPPPPAGPPCVGTPFTTGYSASDMAELQRGADWMRIPASELQKTGVYVLKFLVAIGPNAKRRETVNPKPETNGPVKLTSCWENHEIASHLDDMSYHYRLNRLETHRAGSALLTFLAAIDRHNKGG